MSREPATITWTRLFGLWKQEKKEGSKQTQAKRQLHESSSWKVVNHRSPFVLAKIFSFATPRRPATPPPPRLPGFQGGLKSVLPRARPPQSVESWRWHQSVKGKAVLAHPGGAAQPGPETYRLYVQFRPAAFAKCSAIILAPSSG